MLPMRTQENAGAADPTMDASLGLKPKKDASNMGTSSSREALFT